MGNKQSVFVQNGASNHYTTDRPALDYYATDPKAIDLLLEQESFNYNIWECAYGEGHLSNGLVKTGYNVYCTDIVERSMKLDKTLDFLEYQGQWEGDIITNPPYNKPLEFVKKALEVVNDGSKVAMFLKLTFLETKKRKQFFLDNPPKVIYVSSSRLYCAKNGKFDEKKDSSAIAYCWYIWEKGYKGDTIVKWIN